MIKSINSVSTEPKYTTFSNKNSTKPQEVSCGIQTSIYNTRGANIWFGSLAKAQNVIEAECIQMLRKIRENRYRKFAEDDIQTIINDLRKVQNPNEKQHVLEEVLKVEDETSGLKPDKKIIKQLISINSGRPEDERFAILEFAENELQNATEPLKAFVNLPKEKQDKLVKILQKIDDINEQNLYKSDNTRNETVNSLYDLFRVLVYTEDDLSKNTIKNTDKYKIDQLKLLQNDLKYFENYNGYNNNISKEKVTTTANQIYNYFLENII